MLPVCAGGRRFVRFADQGVACLLKEHVNSMVTAAVVRTLLIVDMVGMALLALIYLRQRKLEWSAFCFWGLLCVAVPVLGPFLVIANRPGQWDPNFSFFGDVRRLGEYARRMLPEEPLFQRNSKKQTMAERVRRRRQKRERKAPK